MKNINNIINSIIESLISIAGFVFIVASPFSEENNFYLLILGWVLMSYGRIYGIEKKVDNLNKQSKEENTSINIDKSQD